MAWKPASQALIRPANPEPWILIVPVTACLGA